jgi:hypothetical protein
MNRAAAELAGGTDYVGESVEEAFEAHPEFASELAKAETSATDDRDLTDGGTLNRADSRDGDISLTRDGGIRH